MDSITYKYWIISDGLRKGPYNYDELRGLSLDEDTPVWREGLPNWIAIKDLPEFHEQYKVVIPPIPLSSPTITPPIEPETAKPMPPTYIAWSIVAMLLCCLIPGIVALCYSSKVSSRYSAGDYQGAQKASETACIWLIITIVCGLISFPFQILFAFL